MPVPPPEQNVRRAYVRFIAGFVIVSGVLLTFFPFPYPNPILMGAYFSYLHGYAVMVGAVLHLFDSSVHTSGLDVIGRVSMRIVRGCDACEVVILFTAAVVSYPWRSWRARCIGVIAGVPCLVLANVLRLQTLYYVLLYAPSAFDTIHLEIWPLVLIAMTLGLFMAWLRCSQPWRMALS